MKTIKTEYRQVFYLDKETADLLEEACKSKSREYWDKAGNVCTDKEYGEYMDRCMKYANLELDFSIISDRLSEEKRRGSNEPPPTTHKAYGQHA